MATKDKTHDSNPDPITGEPGAHPLGVAGGGTGGAVAGAAIGGAVGGPVGAVVGGVVGAVAGGLAGKGAAESVNPTVEDAYWRENFRTRPYYTKGREYDHYAPAYRYGWESATRHTGRRFEDVESDLSKGWTSFRGKAATEWNDVKQATRDAFERARTRTTPTPGMTQASEMSGDAARYMDRKTDGFWDEVKGNWHQFKGSIKAKWNDLTDDDIDQMRGEREKIFGKIQEKYGKAKWKEADIEKEFRGFRN